MKPLHSCKNFILFINLLLLTVCSCYGADTARGIFQYYTGNGLPSNDAYMCVQDKYGYMWIGTKKGVVKYNGYSFRTFTTKDGLPSDEIWRMYPDSYGRIWLGTFGYNIGYIRNDVFTSVINSDVMVGLGDIQEIDGDILLNAQNLFVIDKNDNVLQAPGYAYNGYSLPHLGLDKKIYLQMPGSNLFIYSLVNGKLSVKETNGYNTDSLFLLQNFYWLYDNMKAMCIGSDGSMLHIYDVAKNKIASMQFGNNERAHLLYFIDKRAGYYALTNKSVYFLNYHTRQLYDVKKVTDIVPSGSPLSFIFIDSFQNSWYSTQKDGVWKKVPTAAFLKKDSKLQMLDKAKRIGILSNGDTYWWHKYTHTLTGIDKNLNVIHSEIFTINPIWVAAKGKDTLYVNSPEGFYLYDLKNGKLLEYFKYYKYSKINYYKFDKRSGDKQGQILDSVLKRYSRRILGTYPYSNDIIYANTRTNVIRHYVVNDSLFVGTDFGFNERTDKVLYDSTIGRFWLVNKGTIALLNPVTEKFVMVPPGIFRRIGIRNIEDFIVDNMGNVFVLSTNRLLLFNYRKLKGKIIYLNADATGAKMCIAGNQLYICGAHGIWFAPISPEANLSPARMVANPDYAYYTKVEDVVSPDGIKILMTTDKGLFVPYIPGIKAGSKPMQGTWFYKRVATYKGATQKLSNNDTLYIPNETININLDIVNFSGKGKPTYYYSADGGDWQTSTTGEILLSHTPGRFHTIRYVVSDDVWRSNRYTLYVMQLPNWWQTTTWKRIFWVCGILLFMAFGLLVAYITRYYVRKASEKKQALTDMELRALYAQINPHFIFNTLGAAQFFINRKKMDEAYNHVNKFARLLRAYLKASSNRYVNLAEEISLLKDYIELQQIRFEQKFEYSIEVDNKIAQESMQIPTLLLQPLVENAINHGLFHLPESIKGLLQVKFIQGKSSEELVCIIEDNGVGRERARELKKDSTLEKDASYGTTLTKKLIDIFKEYEKMDIYLEYVDKPAPETGTIVKLTIGNIKYVA